MKPARTPSQKGGRSRSLSRSLCIFGTWCELGCRFIEPRGAGQRRRPDHASSLRIGRHSTDRGSASAATRIKAISSTPAQPPPMNANRVHQTEIMEYVLPQRALADLAICGNAQLGASAQKI